MGVGAGAASGAHRDARDVVLVVVEDGEADRAAGKHVHLREGRSECVRESSGGDRTTARPRPHMEQRRVKHSLGRAAGVVVLQCGARRRVHGATRAMVPRLYHLEMKDELVRRAFPVPALLPRDATDPRENIHAPVGELLRLSLRRGAVEAAHFPSRDTSLNPTSRQTHNKSHRVIASPISSFLLQAVSRRVQQFTHGAP